MKIVWTFCVRWSTCCTALGEKCRLRISGRMPPTTTHHNQDQMKNWRSILTLTSQVPAGVEWRLPPGESSKNWRESCSVCGSDKGMQVAFQTLAVSLPSILFPAWLTSVLMFFIAVRCLTCLPVPYMFLAVVCCL
jgi:hypothetical protein